MRTLLLFLAVTVLMLVTAGCKNRSGKVATDSANSEVATVENVEDLEALLDEGIVYEEYTESGDGLPANLLEAATITIRASEVENMPADAVIVQAWSWREGGNVHLESAVVTESGGFTMTLPAHPDDMPPLMLLADLQHEGVSVTPETTRSFSVDWFAVYAKSNGDVAIGYAKNNFFKFMYADRPATISGEYTDVDETTYMYHVTLERGWNKIYHQVNEDGSVNWVSPPPRNAPRYGWFFDTSRW